MGTGIEIMDIDRQFGRFMESLCGESAPMIKQIAVVLCAATREGHICMDLRSIAGQAVIFEEGAPEEVIPDQAFLKQYLIASPVVGRPGEFKPLIFDEADRLYLYRYWNYEHDLARALHSRINRSFLLDMHAEKDEAGKIYDLLEGLFGKCSGDIDWQKIAAAICCFRTLCILTGSPGTGKSTTVGAILALLLSVSPYPLRIALTAPTGKAAARLGEAISKAKRNLACPDMIRDAIPEKASTIHRLLESRPYSPYFRYNGSRQLPVDILVVDEASMVDMPLMSKLVRALPETSRLILVGDRNQLASVEAGAVLGDLCGNFVAPPFTAEFIEMLSRVTGSELHSVPAVSLHAGIRDCMVELRKNYRFPEGKSIGRFSAAVQKGDHRQMTDVLKGSLQDGFHWMALPAPGNLKNALRDVIVQEYGPYFAAVMSRKDPQMLYALLEQFRILCAVRIGPYGAANINTLIERILRENGLIPHTGREYSGRPLMVLHNDYHLQLFNGDVGIILREGDRFVACFEDESGGIRHFAPSRLPEHETVFAMTVHKSQGSEFRKILHILPNRDNPMLTRELIYTAVTRAKEEVMLWADEEILRMAVSRVIRRDSGLRDFFHGPA